MVVVFFVKMRMPVGESAGYEGERAMFHAACRDHLVGNFLKHRAGPVKDDDF